MQGGQGQLLLLLHGAEEQVLVWVPSRWSQQREPQLKCEACERVVGQLLRCRSAPLLLKARWCHQKLAS